MADKKDLSLVSYTFGVLSIVFAFFNSGAGLVLGVIGLVQSKKQKTELSKKGNKLSLIGLILSLILLIIQVVFIVYSYMANPIPLV